MLDKTKYEPMFHFGGGVDIYFMYNVAARVEYRIWIPSSTQLNTRAFFFAATYFF